MTKDLAGLITIATGNMERKRTMTRNTMETELAFLRACFERAWNEYCEARKRAEDANTSPDDAEDYWQLCRFYRGKNFHREKAIRALRLIRRDESERFREDR